MNKKLMGMVLGVCCVVSISYGCLSDNSKNNEFDKLVNISQEDISVVTLYTCINGQCLNDELPVITEAAETGYAVSEEDSKRLQELFDNSAMGRLSSESYTYNILVDMKGKRLMFNTIDMSAFFVYEDEKDFVTYEIMLTDEQSTFVKEIERKYTEADENFASHDIGHTVDFSNVKKMAVNFTITDDSCEVEAVPDIGGLSLHSLSDGEKALFTECFGEIRLELCSAGIYDYDCIISVGEKLLMINMENKNIYLVYDKDKSEKTYYAEMTNEQIALIEQLLETYK